MFWLKPAIPVLFLSKFSFEVNDLDLTLEFGLPRAHFWNYSSIQLELIVNLQIFENPVHIFNKILFFTYFFVEVNDLDVLI